MEDFSIIKKKSILTMDWSKCEPVIQVGVMYLGSQGCKNENVIPSHIQKLVLSLSTECSLLRFTGHVTRYSISESFLDEESADKGEANNLMSMGTNVGTSLSSGVSGLCNFLDQLCHCQGRLLSLPTYSPQNASLSTLLIHMGRSSLSTTLNGAAFI